MNSEVGMRKSEYEKNSELIRISAIRILLNYILLPYLSQSPRRSQSFYDFSLRTL